MHELIETYFWEIVDDFLYSEDFDPENMSEELKQEMIDEHKEAFDEYAQEWVSEL